jgi:hypothetical protein
MSSLRNPVLLWVLALVALVVAPACAERQLGGIQIGDSPLALMQSRQFGPPDGMYTTGGVFNKLSQAALADTREPPPWAYAVRTEALLPNQVEWVYNKDPLAYGLVITGQGAEATVTNIIISMWRIFAPSNQVRTERGIRLGDTLASVLAEYQYPSLLMVLQESPIAGGALAVGAAAPVTTGSFRFGRRDEVGGAPPALPAVSPGTAVVPGAHSLTATLSIGGSPITFTKDLLLDYPGVEFTLYGMKVVRIHIYG